MNITDKIREIREELYKININNKNNISLCVSLDALTDAEDAIIAYKELMDSGKEYNKALCYLLIYGVLNAIFLQHEALKKIYHILDIKFNSLSEITKYRHNLVVHPFSKAQDGETKSYSIVQGELFLKQFNYQEYNHSDYKEATKNCNIQDLLCKRENEYKKMCDEILKNFDNILKD